MAVSVVAVASGQDLAKSLGRNNRFSFSDPLDAATFAALQRSILAFRDLQLNQFKVVARAPSYVRAILRQGHLQPTASGGSTRARACPMTAATTYPTRKAHLQGQT